MLTTGTLRYLDDAVVVPHAAGPTRARLFLLDTPRSHGDTLALELPLPAWPPGVPTLGHFYDALAALGSADALSSLFAFHDAMAAIGHDAESVDSDMPTLLDLDVLP